MQELVLPLSKLAMSIFSLTELLLTRSSMTYIADLIIFSLQEHCLGILEAGNCFAAGSKPILGAQACFGLALVYHRTRR